MRGVVAHDRDAVRRENQDPAAGYSVAATSFDFPSWFRASPSFL